MVTQYFLIIFENAYDSVLIVVMKKEVISMSKQIALLMLMIIVTTLVRILKVLVLTMLIRDYFKTIRIRKLH